VHRRAPILLLFTLGSRRESARRRLLPARFERYETAFREGLARHVSSVAARANCELVISSPDPLPYAERWIRQSGDGFGERLASSLEAVGYEGRRPVVVVGSDTPAMTERHVAAALRELDADPEAVVIGPSRDGGMYLIGMATPIDVWNAVRWCGRHAREDFVAALREAGRPIVFLEPLADLDTTRDLERWLAKPAVVPALVRISILLRSLLNELRRLVTHTPLRPSATAGLSASIRPPPPVPAS
jgi:2-phospho-L-lactate guanylyltransferase (CobY/MobA/RfbA family)